jgi:hypothetical protein
MLRDNPLNDHLIAPEQPAEEKTETPSPRTLYRTYLPEIVGRVRTDEIYPYLRDRDTDPDSAKRELDAAIDRIVLSMREEHPDFYEAYTTCRSFGSGSMKMCSSGHIRTIWRIQGTASRFMPMIPVRRNGYGKPAHYHHPRGRYRHHREQQ